MLSLKEERMKRMFWESCKIINEIASNCYCVGGYVISMHRSKNFDVVLTITTAYSKVKYTCNAIHCNEISFESFCNINYTDKFNLSSYKLLEVIHNLLISRYLDYERCGKV